jgi:hypothetical protein
LFPKETKVKSARGVVGVSRRLEEGGASADKSDEQRKKLRKWGRIGRKMACAR